MTSHIGLQLGNYQLIELLGQGHWASVYLHQTGPGSPTSLV